MEYVRKSIPGLSLPVSPLFFGTAMPPINLGEDGSDQLLDSVLEEGINAFDCARSYGRAEETLGGYFAGFKDTFADAEEFTDSVRARFE